MNKKHIKELNNTLNLFTKVNNLTPINSDLDKENCRELQKLGYVIVALDNHGGMLAKLTYDGLRLKQQGGFKKKKIDINLIVQIIIAIATLLSVIVSFMYSGKN